MNNIEGRATAMIWKPQNLTWLIGLKSLKQTFSQPGCFMLQLNMLFNWNTGKSLPKSSLLIMINSVANSGDNNDSEQKNRCYPDLADKSGMLCDFFKKFLYNMPGHCMPNVNFYILREIIQFDMRLMQLNRTCCTVDWCRLRHGADFIFYWLNFISFDKRWARKNTLYT